MTWFLCAVIGYAALALGGRIFDMIELSMVADSPPGLKFLVVFAMVVDMAIGCWAMSFILRPL